MVQYPKWCAPLITTVAVLAVFTSCADAPTEADVTRDAPPSVSTKSDAGNTARKGVVYFANVQSGGALVEGSALSAQRVSEGFYHVTFAQSVVGCGSVANSTAFDRFDASIFRVVAHVQIGAPGTDMVRVRLFNVLDGTEEDSSFSVVLVCP
jgi:hypothetical protein